MGAYAAEQEVQKEEWGAKGGCGKEMDSACT
jgi:hypothetical protein